MMQEHDGHSHTTGKEHHPPEEQNGSQHDTRGVEQSRNQETGSVQRDKRAQESSGNDNYDVIEHLMDLSTLAEKLGTNIDIERPQNSTGLTLAEAEARLRENGPNKLSPPKATPE
eukprot:gb/GECG01013003.1/.p1 GENE.gb/GECG01013003.1/~~gb/GECG01013003.1/.p1  ORF type:complete len:115 (+),score=26.17 gb/GECG01013003.1/:1-345(+)